VYDPYGEVTIYDDDWSETRSTSSYANNILFAGYYHDDETGLYHVRHRYYHVHLGVWLQRDPLGYVNGPGLYGYCGGGPLGATDPMGLKSREEIMEEIDAEARAWEDLANRFEDLADQLEQAADEAEERDDLEAKKKFRDEADKCRQEAGACRERADVARQTVVRGDEEKKWYPVLWPPYENDKGQQHPLDAKVDVQVEDAYFVVTVTVRKAESYTSAYEGYGYGDAPPNLLLLFDRHTPRDRCYGRDGDDFALIAARNPESGQFQKQDVWTSTTDRGNMDEDAWNDAEVSTVSASLRVDLPAAPATGTTEVWFWHADLKYASPEQKSRTGHALGQWNVDYDYSGANTFDYTVTHQGQPVVPEALRPVDY
jgi:RHS repeat-associated protein